ncbi:MAG: hypothetical protein KAI43_10600 [Candidatus Aureabacteria bacterium]|nr:hypothetical protein [Candidatus Auribacterota bacterium]
MRYFILLFILFFSSGCNVKKFLYKQTPEGKNGKSFSKFENEQEKKKNEFNEMKHHRTLSNQDSSDFIKDNITLTLGPAEVYIHSISATKKPIVLGTMPPKIGNQYIQFKIEIKKLQSNMEFVTNNLFLTTLSGIKHIDPKVYMKLNENDTISESYTVLFPTEAFIIFFEIKESEDITKLILAYQ